MPDRPSADRTAELLLWYLSEPSRYRAEGRRRDAPPLDPEVVLKLALGRQVVFTGVALNEPRTAVALQKAAAFYVRHIFLRADATPYQTLGLAPGASSQAIKESFRLLMQLVHPDRQDARGLWPESCAAQANRAYRALRDQDTRRRFDQEADARAALARAIHRAALRQGASDRLHDAVSVNTVRNVSLAPNNSGQVFGGGVVVFSHLLVNSGNVTEGDGTGSSITLALANSISGWSAVVYYDANNSGTVDGGDTLVTNLAFVSAGGAGLAPGESVRLLVQVFSPPGAPLGAVDSTTLTATTANGTFITTVPPAVSVTDSSAVISGDVRLVKEQALDANLDGLPDSAYGTTDITTGALPGRSIRYRITVTNIGSVAATVVKVFDTTPAYTTYTSTGPAATTRGSVTTAPANGASGALEFNIGALNPGESAIITFGVIITP